MRTIPLLLGALLWLVAPFLAAQNPAEGLPRTSAPADAEAYIQSPADGARVSSPVLVRFGLRGMGVSPAGLQTPIANTGHHHLLIDVDSLPPMNLPLPATDNIRHFGAGQTETELELPPGEHTLQLVLGDALHIPHEPPVVSAPITITVVE
jgi:hypothetical protein